MNASYTRITIITPSYNQGEFLESTIQSVLSQNYPNLEYMILDGGSTDGSVEIIRKYERYLSYWRSAPDGGQSKAINEGIQRATGEWVNWLNSDDILLPNALHTLAQTIELVPDAQWISGTSLYINKSGTIVDFRNTWNRSPEGLAFGAFWLSQESTFLRTSFLQRYHLKFREDLYIVFDEEAYRRFTWITPPLFLTVPLGAMRVHEAQKTRLVERKNDEYQRNIAPFMRERLPLFSRLLIRSQRTRFGVIATALIRVIVHFGLTRLSRECRVVYYSNGDLKVGPARNLA